MKSLNSIKKLVPNSTEWFGYYHCKEDNRVKTLKSKSFEKLLCDERDLRCVYLGLFEIMSGDGNYDYFKNNVVKISGEVPLVKVQDNVLDTYVFIVLKTLYEKIISERPFFYTKEINYTSKIKGSINFGRTISKNFGLKHKVVTESFELKYNDPFLSLLRFYYRFFDSVLKKSMTLSISLKDELSMMTSHVDSYFSECEELGDYSKSSMGVISGVLGNSNFKLRALVPEMKVLANLYLVNNLFFNKDLESSELYTDGLVFNLNRPFELLLRRACSTFLEENGNKFVHKNQKEFSALVDEQNAVKLQMKPDCWFYVNSVEVILDAKHKVFEEQLISNEGIDYEQKKIDRNDLYQIMSYCSTSPEDSKIQDKIVGLVGLSEESQEDGADYVQSSMKWTVSGHKDFPPVNIVSMNFGRFMLDLGRQIDRTDLDVVSNPTYESIFYSLGKSINEHLKIVENNELIKLYDSFFDYVVNDCVDDEVREIYQLDIESDGFFRFLKFYNKLVLKKTNRAINLSPGMFKDEEKSQFVALLKKDLNDFLNDDEDYEDFSSTQYLSSLSLIAHTGAA